MDKSAVKSIILVAMKSAIEVILFNGPCTNQDAQVQFHVQPNVFNLLMFFLNTTIVPPIKTNMGAAKQYVCDNKK